MFLKLLFFQGLFFNKYLRHYMQYTDSKTFSQATFKNKAENTDVY